MKALLVIAIIFGGGYFWYAKRYLPNVAKNDCLYETKEIMDKTRMGSLDATQYCGCAAEAEFGEKAAQNANPGVLASEIKNCANQYLMAPLASICNSNNGYRKNSSASLDCKCFSSKLIDDLIQMRGHVKKTPEKVKQLRVYSVFNACERR